MQTPRLEAAATLERFAANFAGLQPQPGAVVSLGTRRAALTSRTQWLPVQDFLDEIRRLARV